MLLFNFATSAIREAGSDANDAVIAQVLAARKPMTDK